jgi:hypothetical protein
MIPELKELVKKNRYVEFAFYRSGFFYYNIIIVHLPQHLLEIGDAHAMAKREIYQFPVPIEGIGNATLLLHDKAITYMRYIRKAIEDKTLIKLP